VAVPYRLLRSTARWSCSLFMFDRPSIPICLASLYSCSRVRPFGRFDRERSHPRLDDDMSLTDEREADFAWPDRAAPC
jgi:hypothetical protein